MPKKTRMNRWVIHRPPEKAVRERGIWPLHPITIKRSTPKLAFGKSGATSSRNPVHAEPTPDLLFTAWP
jgi:hypothetical protein